MKRQAGSLGSGQLLLLGLWPQQLGKGRVPTSLASCTQLSHHHEEFWYSSKYCSEAKGCTGCKIVCTHQCSKEIRFALDTVMILLKVLCGCDLCIWSWCKYEFDYDHHVWLTLLKWSTLSEMVSSWGGQGEGEERRGKGARQQKTKQHMDQAHSAQKMNQSTNQCSNNKPAGN